MVVAVEAAGAVRREQRIHEVEARLAELNGIINAAEAERTALVADALAEDLWAQVDVHSPEHWLAWKSGLSRAHAGRIVRTARRWHELPRLRKAMTEGRLSSDQAALVAKRCPTGFDTAVVETATQMTVPQLEHSLRSYAWPDEVEDPRAVPEGAAEEARTVRFGVTDQAGWRMATHLPVDEGAVVEAAMKASREDLFNDRHGRDAIDAGAASDVSDADALVNLARHYLATGRAQHWDPDRYRVHLYLDDDPAAPGGPRVAHLGRDLAPVPDAIRRMLTCDATVVTVHRRAGRLFSVGRAERVVNRRLRRYLERRDGGCLVPGCTHRRFLVIHHVVHWEDGGTTDEWNLICLCPHHHRQHHLGLLGIAGDLRTGLRFTDRFGRELGSAPAVVPPDAPVAEAAPTVLGRPMPTYEPPLGERCWHKWIDYFENPDRRLRVVTDPDPP